MNQAYLLIGGNQGNRHRFLQQSIEEIRLHCGKIVSLSSVYETAAWGKEDQPPFLNQALELETVLEPLELLVCLLEIEKTMGRERTVKFGPRIIDIDILFFNDWILDMDRLTIPHPQLANRRFALEPLNEIAPRWMHPVLHQTVHRLLMDCKDSLDVKKL